MRFRLDGARRTAALGMFMLLTLWLSGCATPTRTLLQSAPADLPRHVELSATPFHPQDRYQCGPATLAMALGAANIRVTPNELKPQVYVPQREGSLQTEMLAAGRRNGAFSMTIPPRLDALLPELAAGNPVIVLQNLSLPWFPRWHYALAIGYDLDEDTIILRSGTIAREVLPLSTFQHTWKRSGNWAMVALPPGRLPASAQEESAVDALVAFGKGSDPVSVRKSYDIAVQRWPHNIILRLGQGNAAYAAGDKAAAASTFRHATEEHPDSAPAFNNLATVLAELGDFEQARAAARTAVALGGPWREAADATLQTIETARRKAAPGNN